MKVDMRTLLRDYQGASFDSNTYFVFRRCLDRNAGEPRPAEVLLLAPDGYLPSQAGERTRVQVSIVEDQTLRKSVHARAAQRSE